MRYKILLEYNGINFIGWQKQIDNPNSIQEVIEKAIFNLTGENVEVISSGRTDAGVHALGQVAHFDLMSPQSSFKMLGGLNHYLRGSDVCVLDCEEVDQNFHSRFCAKMRHYQYLIINRHAHLTLCKNRAWKISYLLNLEKMIEASQYLIGEHDFTSFRDSECQAKNPIRTIEKIEIFKEGQMIKMNFSAQSFLHHQVRNMVGTLVMIGGERIDPKEIKVILEAKDRQKSGPNAPACGLYFLKVDY